MVDFNAVNARVCGVSVDPPYAQNVWIREEKLNLPLLSDVSRELANSYDVVHLNVFPRCGMVRKQDSSVLARAQSGVLDVQLDRFCGAH